MTNIVLALGINVDNAKRYMQTLSKRRALARKLERLEELETMVALETAPIEEAGAEIIEEVPSVETSTERKASANILTNESNVMQNKTVETNPLLNGTTVDPKNEFFGNCIDTNTTGGSVFNTAIPPVDMANMFNNCIDGETTVDINMNIGEEKLEPVTRPASTNEAGPVFADRTMYEAFTDTLDALSTQGYSFINEPADQGMVLITPVLNGKEIPEKKFFVDKEGKYYNNIPKVIVGDVYIDIEKPNEMASLILFILKGDPVVGTKLLYTAVIAGEGANDEQLKYLKFFKDKDSVKEILQRAYKVDKTARFKLKSWKDNKNFSLISDSTVLGFNNEKVDRPTQIITVKAGKVKLTSEQTK